MIEDFIIDIQLTNGAGVELELANVMIDAVLYAEGRQRYRFYLGMTDAQGRLCATFDLLESERLQNQSLSIMDYNTKLQDCDSRISFIVPSSDELQEFKNAIEKWYPENISQLDNIEKSKNRELMCERVDVHIESGRKKVFLVCENCDKVDN